MTNTFLSAIYLCVGLIGTKEAAKKLGVSQQRVQKLIKDGRLPAQLIGRDYIINEKSLVLVANRKTGRPPKKVGKKSKK